MKNIVAFVALFLALFAGVQTAQAATPSPTPIHAPYNVVRNGVTYVVYNKVAYTTNHYTVKRGDSASAIVAKEFFGSFALAQFCNRGFVFTDSRLYVGQRFVTPDKAAFKVK